MQLDENGKPCKACNSMTNFQKAMFSPTTKAPESAQNAVKPSVVPEENDPFRQEPPDSGQLGRSTWTYLHSLAAYFPKNPTSEQQAEAKQLVTLFANFYPCKPCAQDFQKYIKSHEIDSSNRENFSLWMCDAHNAVNKKLGKRQFDCRYWSQRWREGWEDFLASQKKGH